MKSQKINGRSTAKGNENSPTERMVRQQLELRELMHTPMCGV